MATAQHSAAPSTTSPGHRGVQPLRAGEGYSFVWRKLHSLSGIVPIGAFLLEHILSNFEALKGPAAYGAQVRFLNSLPLVRVLEWTFIFLPILYHGIYGVYIWLRGQSNVVYYPWAGNWMYVAQRWTGLIAFAYIVQHVLRQRFLGVSLPENPGAAFAKVQHELVESHHGGDLCDRHDCGLLALCLRRLALRGQVGHHPRRRRRAGASAGSASPVALSWRPWGLPASGRSSDPNIRTLPKTYLFLCSALQPNHCGLRSDDPELLSQ